MGLPSISVVLCLWLREVHGKCGLGANAVVDPERLDLRLLVNFAPMTRGLRADLMTASVYSLDHTDLLLHIGLGSSSTWAPPSEGKVRRGVLVPHLAQLP